MIEDFSAEVEVPVGPGGRAHVVMLSLELAALLTSKETPEVCAGGFQQLCSESQGVSSGLWAPG